MAFTFKLTAAGLAAIKNPASNGTAAKTIVTAGITATAIAPGAPVANEIKRLSTISGAVVAADTIHVTIQDETADAYTVRGFGLYLDDGTLLGSYGQADPIINKTSASIMLLSTDMRMLDGSSDISTLVFGDANFANPAATTERFGVVKLATVAEATAGTRNDVVVTPAGLRQAAGNRLPFFTAGEALPTVDIGPIWHDLYGSIMTWRVFNENGANYTGYVSVDVGKILGDTQLTPRAGYKRMALAGANSKTSYAGWWNWALHHGMVVPLASWAHGTLYYADNGDGTFRAPDVRAEYPRFADDGRGVNTSAAFAAWLNQQLPDHFHKVDLNALNSSGDTGWGKLATGGQAAEGYINPLDSWGAVLQSGVAGTVGFENRPRTTNFQGAIHF